LYNLSMDEPSLRRVKRRGIAANARRIKSFFSLSDATLDDTLPNDSFEVR
jgi:hypothetical protein